MRKLVRNAIRCKLCGDTIESKALYDFQMCSCGACYINGGLDYQDIGGDPDNYEILTEYVDAPGYYFTHWDVSGTRYAFTTTDSREKIDRMIKTYEGWWGFVLLEDENHNELYRTYGLENFLKRKGKKLKKI